MAANLVDWLRAELDRVEQIAQVAAEPDGPTWTHNPGDHWLISGQGGHPLVYDEGTPTGEQAQHIALWDPAAVLRRVAADRQILAEHKAREIYLDDRDLGCERFLAAICSCCGGSPSGYPCATLRLLAEGYGWTGPQ